MSVSTARAGVGVMPISYCVGINISLIGRGIKILNGTDGIGCRASGVCRIFP